MSEEDGIVIERPVLHRIGSIFHIEWTQAQVRAACRNIREHSDALTSEITWTYWSGDRWAVLYRSQMNMNSPTTRGSVSKALAERAKFAFNWRAAIDQLCILVPDEWRRGEPIVMLHEVATPEEPAFLISRLLPEGVSTVLYADGQAGKSVIALGMALAVANGQPFGGRYQVKHAGPVLYLDWETSKEDHAFREKRLWSSGQYGQERSHPVYYGRMTGPLADQVERLQEFVVERNVTLVVYDSLGWATGDELKEAGPAIRVMDAARAIGGTALFLAHVTKAEAQKARKGEAVATIFGSKYFELAARYTWEMAATQDELDGSKGLVLRNRKANAVRRSEPVSLRLEFEGSGGPISIQDMAADQDAAGPGSLAQRLMVALRKGAKTCEELAGITGSSADAIRVTLNRMAKDETVRQVTLPGPNQPARWGLAAPEYAGQQPSFVAPKPVPDAAQEAVQDPDEDPPETTAQDPLEGLAAEEICGLCGKARADRYTPKAVFVCGPCGDLDLQEEGATA